MYQHQAPSESLASLASSSISNQPSADSCKSNEAPESPETYWPVVGQHVQMKIWSFGFPKFFTMGGDKVRKPTEHTHDLIRIANKEIGTVPGQAVDSVRKLISLQYACMNTNTIVQPQIHRNPS